MTTPALEVLGLTVSYRRAGEWATAVSSVSLAIGAGEAYGLVGESGCGKTTLALALMRYLPRNGRIDAGAIRVDGHDLARMAERDLRRWRGTRLAMVYQDPASALNPALRIGDQIAEVYRFHRGETPRGALRSAHEALVRVRMPDPGAVLHRYPHQLSGGQQQRVVIAMALAGNPRLLILDEPTTGLDVTIEAEVLELITALRQEIDAAILLISHNLGLVARMCDRIGVMYAGQVVEEGRAREVLTTPRHPYTMGLLRCLPRFGATKQEILLEPIPGGLPFLGDRIPGCAFHPRCVLARDRCRTEAPELQGVEPGRRSRCHFWAEVETMPRVTPAAPLRSSPVSHERLLTITGLRKTYRGRGQSTVAVHDVSLEVMKGETFGLVGESGSGKTTLARCLVGLTEPDGGELTFAGRQAPWRGRDRGRATLQAMQMVFQNPDTTLNPSWTVRGILGRAVRVFLGLHGRAQARRVAELASRVRLEPRHLDLRAGQLSGGLRQRAAIARALAGKPALAVCDEPVSALDVSVQAAILGLLLELQAAEGVSYVLISHDLAVVRYLADRIGVMYLAQLVEVGEAAAVFGGPQHPYTEALLSAVPALDLETTVPRLRLGGPIPSLSHPPAGCRFHTRCPRKLGAICEEQEPPWQDAGAGHLIRCHIPPDELRKLQTRNGRSGNGHVGDRPNPSSNP
ncbi:MAG TPA: ABC transporter ATP-binding protein [bacterium]|nr:ABC transporter ATP-binding protein [bacterium]